MWMRQLIYLPKATKYDINISMSYAQSNVNLEYIKSIPTIEVEQDKLPVILNEHEMLALTQATY